MLESHKFYINLGSSLNNYIIVSKKLLLPVVMFFIGSLMLSSCKKEGCTDSNASNYNSEAKKDDGSCVYPADPVPTAPFKAEVDGVIFNVDDIEITVQSFVQQLTIRGLRNDGKYIRITVPLSISSGTYSFEDPFLGSRTGAYYDGSSIYGAAAGTGTLNIVSHNTTNNTISGFFSFSATPYSSSSGTDSYTISNGEFVGTY